VETTVRLALTDSLVRMKFELRESALLRLALGPVRFDPWEFFNEGAYPEHRPEKDEVEAFVREYVGGLDRSGLEVAVQRHAEYLREWVPDRVEAAQSHADCARLCAFAELHNVISDAEHELMLASLLAPDRSHPVFDEHPELYDDLTDGLMRLTPGRVEEPWIATNAAFFVGDSVLFPHPFLVEYRELLGALADLASAPALAVYVAIDPHRVGHRDKLQYRLLEDYWDGLKLTPQTLDSLDRHDQGSSFHAAGERGEAEAFLHPLLGTWFHWKARGDNQMDPVKRLYIQELKPGEDRHGDPFEAVLNRELHAERDTSTKKFTHVDGKIVRYLTETYAPMATNPRALPGPHERARKLWRVDGPMSDEQWMEVVGLFFRDNELIGEHFEDAFAERV
jgi:hypothetical protein